MKVNVQTTITPEDRAVLDDILVIQLAEIRDYSTDRKGYKNLLQRVSEVAQKLQLNTAMRHATEDLAALGDV